MTLVPGLKTGAMQTRSINGALGTCFNNDLIRSEAKSEYNYLAPGETLSITHKCGGES